MLIAPLLALAAQSARLDACVLRSERIVLARVEHVDQLGRSRGTLDVIELTLERALVGRAEEKRMFVLDAEVQDASAAPLRAGERVLAFLEPWRGKLTSGQQKNLDKMLPGVTFYGALSRWSPAGQDMPAGVRVPGELVDELYAAGAGSTPEALLAWVDAALDRTLPSIEGLYGTTSPAPWNVRVGPDHRVHRGDESEELGEEPWKALWALVEEIQFDALPEKVGQSKSSNDPYGLLTVRTRKGPKRVRVYPQSAAEEAESAAQVARALRLWEALPGASKPVLRATESGR